MHTLFYSLDQTRFGKAFVFQGLRPKKDVGIILLANKLRIPYSVNASVKPQFNSKLQGDVAVQGLEIKQPPPSPGQCLPLPKDLHVQQIPQTG